MTLNEKKILTASGTLLVIIAITVLVLTPFVRKIKFYNTTISQRQAQVISLKNQIANKPALTQEIAKLDQLIKDSDIFIRVDNKQSADAQLLSMAKKIIEDAGGQINSVNPIAQAKRGNTKNISRVRIDLMIDNEGMIEVFKNMSGSKPLMNISGANLTPTLKRINRKLEDTGKYRVILDIEAFYASGDLS